MKDILQKSRAKSKLQPAGVDRAKQGTGLSQSQQNATLKTTFKTKDSPKSSSSGNRAIIDLPVNITQPQPKKTLTMEKMQPNLKTHNERLDNPDKKLSITADSAALDDASVTTDELDAQREMRRNLRDIGPVVATLNLEDSDDEQWSSEEESGEDEDDAEENGYGMTSIQHEISEDYISQMEDLMKKHAIGQERAKPSPKSILNSTKEQSNEKASSSSNSKGVRFAESLDIASLSPPSFNAVTQGESEPTTFSKLNPVSDIVVERKPLQKSEGQPPVKKVSRFKATRQSQARSSDDIKSIDDLKDDLEDQNLTHDMMKNEFALYKGRMNNTSQQMDRRLFKEVDQGENVIIDEGNLKISKFKAARLGYVDDSADGY
jgi:Domain of unknown function (DUF3835)